MLFELIREPDEIKNMISICSRVWKGEKVEKIKLFSKGDEVNICEYLPRDVSNYKNNDDKIFEYIGSNDTFPTALWTINAKYNTQIRIEKQKWNNEAWNRDNTGRMCKTEIDKLYKKSGIEMDNQASGIDEFVEVCKKITGRYEYSFATKVFSFVSRNFCTDGLPIYDSLVVTLLNYYLEQKNQNCKKSTWSEYRVFKESYDLFRYLYKLDEYTYKDIDVFLWTYGSAIKKYWNKQGVLSFNAVSYTPIEKRKHL
ncbi:MAG: hypothetical protein IJG50_08650 [Clostridia bacterium]|nr:hypothetical protein [Clostridia bacterium]